MIVSNPPYIPTEDIEDLMREVRDHEPHLALDGSKDGLHFYRKLAEESGRYLVPGGSLLFEIGYDQGKAVSQLLDQAGFKDTCEERSGRSGQSRLCSESCRRWR